MTIHPIRDRRRGPHPWLVLPSCQSEAETVEILNPLWKSRHFASIFQFSGRHLTAGCFWIQSCSGFHHGGPSGVPLCFYCLLEDDDLPSHLSLFAHLLSASTALCRHHCAQHFAVDAKGPPSLPITSGPSQPRVAALWPGAQQSLANPRAIPSFGVIFLNP